ncbi:pilus assembly protein [Paenibacillus aurantiacus]|uniref:Pilus assembly protein n=1 Tax=Paenibacillus aurantiacus TaxID=1936118 RepID=A0ABV5KHX6_9BACL
MIKRTKFSPIRRLGAIIRGDEGSYTLEASFVFPALFTVMTALLLFGLYVYQQVAVYYVASVSAERAAFVWGNSHRDPDIGIAPAGAYDGLYWRVGDDAALQSVFKLAGASGASITVPIGEEVDEGDEAEQSLAGRKLLRVTARVPAFRQGALAYTNRLLTKEVEADLSPPMNIPLLGRLGHQVSLQTASLASIVDPVELIRNVDLARYYTAKWNNRADAVLTRANAAAVIQQKAAP